MMVKICGITNLEDGLAAAEAGAAALGFNFYRRSPRYIGPEDAARLAEALPAGVWKVGVFVNEPPADILRIRALVGLDVVQLHGDEPRDQWPRQSRLWRAIRVDETFDPALLEAPEVEAFLLDAPSGEAYGGTGTRFDWKRAVRAGGRVILAGGLDEENVVEAIRTVRPWGVDACSRLEAAPGRKDRPKMVRFIRAALSGDPE